MDGFGPICPVCMASESNARDCEALRLALPQLRGPVRMTIVEMVHGNGYEDLCDCGECGDWWFHRGWVCPARWNLHLAMRGQRGQRP